MRKKRKASSHEPSCRIRRGTSARMGLSMANAIRFLAGGVGGMDTAAHLRMIPWNQVRHTEFVTVRALRGSASFGKR